MPEFSLTCLGVGDGTVDAERNKSAYLFRFQDTSLLVDCGEPVSRALKAAGVKAEDLDRILLSHLHSDHIGGLFMLLQGLWLERRQKPLPIHLPADGVDPIRQLLRVANLVDELLPYKIDFQPWIAGTPVHQGLVHIIPYPTTHLESLRRQFQGKYPGQYASFCFVFEAAGKRIGHSADLGTPEDLEPLLVHPLDALVCELAHFSIKDICGFLQNRPIKRVIFTHLARNYWEDFEGTRRETTRLLPGIPVTYAWDGDVISL